MVDAIRLVGIGKQYRRRIGREPYRTLRDSITAGVRAIMGPWESGRRRAASTDLFWALRDVSLEVPRGAALGLIGGNGAGKSTLLKILSRVTEPTSGHGQLRGRVGSLLEVGTGFHPELTGRENMLLNGAILGMTRAEVARKFDAIVAFAEVEPFIDTPVKHYSSGMYLRLAFSVAAHLDPEILLVDEVLAVGDAAFQKRCLGKMDDVARQGRTVVFVSHNLEAVQRLCTHAALLDKGSLVARGDVATVVSRYLSQGDVRPAPGVWVELSSRDRVGTGEAHFTRVQYNGGSGTPASPACSMGPLEFLIEVESNERRSVGSFAVFLTDQYGRRLVNADTWLIERSISLNRGRTIVKLRIDAVYLTPGVYRVGLWMADLVRGQSSQGAYDYVEVAFEINVVHANPNGLNLDTGALVVCDFTVDEQT
jgi:ABC-type polysaccharide/polyol phosphate transport system ATPase subunit